jgi:hypothetical protein
MLTYIASQDMVRTRAHIQRTTAELVDIWDALVDECQEGYSWDISEFRNELASRDQLEEILRAPELVPYREHRQLRDRAESIDARFRRLLMPDCVFPAEGSWWRRGVLRFAGPSYAGYCRKAHGFEVLVRGD